MRAPAREPPRAQVGPTATVIISVVLVGAAFCWMRDILAPLALAIFLMVVVEGLARVLRRRVPVFPAPAALPVAMIVTTAVFGLTVFIVAGNARSFLTELIHDEPKLDALVANLAAHLGVLAPPTVEQMIAQADIPRYLARVVRSVEGVASGAVFVFVYLVFLSLSRHGFTQKANQLFHTEAGREHARKVFIRIRTGVERYVWIQTLVGLILASASWTLMQWVGLDDALFWAFLIFMAAYVPILGGAVAIFLPPLFALVQFDTHWQALALLLGGETIHFVVGNVVAPRLQGASLNVDPIVVLLSLAFWGAIWGVPGMFLSTPLTVVAIVILVQFPKTRWIAVLLSRDGAPETYSEGAMDTAT